MTGGTSIRRNLVVRLVAGTLAVSCATVGAVYWYLREEIVEQYDLALLSKARALAGVLGVGTDGGPAFPLRPEAIPEYHQQPRDTDYFQVWRADGSVLVRSPSLGAADLPKPDADRGPHGFLDAGLPGGRVGRTAWLKCRAPMGGDGRSDGVPAGAPSPPDMVVAVATSGEEFDETIGHLVVALLTAVVLMSGGTLVVVFAAVGRGLRPVRDIAEAAGRIDAERLGYRFDVAGLPVELRPIADRLNALLARIEEAFQRERRFTANVAHELRTPIAELRASTEVALRWPDDLGLSARGLRDALAVSYRMESVVGALLALVRSESGREAVAFAALDLADVAAVAWGPHAAIAAQRGLCARVDVPSGIDIRSDRTLLVSLLGNLMANAVTHTPVGGSVMVRRMVVGDQPALVIENTNPGLTPDDLPRLTEPFWRKDTSRTDGGHAGLGLALVSSYAAALGTAVRYELIDGVFAASVSVTELKPRDGAGMVAPQ